ncbi:coiled-coil domain-containing protein 134 [Osmia lignaria lignaria]|uniref:coiled-coil domain-containing protein 134-like n=1 Tax=Osmia lignaria TaxID=473952 RepID=UPI001479135F|nr:coiled-coil domain-containing protein 134-like [Osmia lignaria]XP_034193922.1 coiled-coil domain-containing protein 134-like [Osmia lignaria]XP_034193929.1 coiled-coil domain-containing protein 134-like [Osmia lignaria]XP_034193939.1 coiled-coil domain-containing protein 134-like [Osmia lignaria]
MKKMPRFVIYIVVVSTLTRVTHVQQVLSDIENNPPISEKPQNGNPSEIKIYEELFRKSFVHQRKEHTEAIKRLRNIDNYERLYKMITILGTKMIDIIEASKQLIESTDFNPDDRSLPKNVTIQSAISTTLENTALFADILLHFPHMTHRILKTQKEWNPVINWSLHFTNRTKHLLDAETLTVVHLAAQELNIIEREPGYVNPYWQSTGSQGEDEEKKKKKKSKKKAQRVPRITKTDL